MYDIDNNQLNKTQCLIGYQKDEDKLENSDNSKTTLTCILNEEPNQNYLPPFRKKILKKIKNIEEKPFDYKNSNVCINFIRKVYSLLSLQITFTLIFVSVLYLNPEMIQFELKNQWIVYLASGFLIILVYGLIFFKRIARKVPINYISFFLFTVSSTYCVTFAASYYDVLTILISTGLTTAIIIALNLYSIFSIENFTVRGGFIVVSLVVIVGSTAILSMVRMNFYHLVISILGDLFFGFFLVYDTQATIGENQRMYSCDDYIIAALSIYLDILYYFIELMRIAGMANA
jgi:FtsH-binding integral membrane protein